jgi:glycosyltransferase involved in cell wall biosynthesis
MAGVLRKDVPANKIVQVYNGIVLPERVPLTVYNRILFVGRLEKTKGVDYLIDAFAELASEFPDLEMQIVGDGSYRAMLEKQVRALALTNRITFLGWVKDRAQLIHEYAQATILVVPSTLPENLGTVCIEAMAVGRPIIGTNAGGIPELVSDAKTGFLVPVENSKAIAAKVRHLLTHKAELHSMEEAACIRSTDFGLDVFAQRIQKVYMEAMTKI